MKEKRTEYKQKITNMSFVKNALLNGQIVSADVQPYGILLKVKLHSQQTFEISMFYEQGCGLQYEVKEMK